MFVCFFMFKLFVCNNAVTQLRDSTFLELNCVQYLIVTFPDFQKKFVNYCSHIIDERQVYLHGKRFGFHPHHCLNEIR